MQVKTMNENSRESCEVPATDWQLLQDNLFDGFSGQSTPTPSGQVDLLEGVRFNNSNKNVGKSSAAHEGNTQSYNKKTPLPSSNLAYKEKDYWDHRFETEDDYDWMVSYKDLAEHVREAIPKEAKVLVVGCGNSALSADMYDDGYRNLLSTDFSAVVIDKMRRKHGSIRPGLRWEQMDMLALDLKDNSIDAVVDKAAMDALIVDKGDPWNPNETAVEQSHRMCSEVSRVLVPGGVFVQLSFEQEHFRRKFLLGEFVMASPRAKDSHRSTTPTAHLGVESGQAHSGSGSPDYGWDLTAVDIQREGGCFGHFLYVMRKRRIDDAGLNPVK